MTLDLSSFESAVYGASEGRHGSFFTLRSDNYVSRSIERYGEWCEAELTLLAQVIEPGDVVVDAGANIGTHTLAFANMVGPGGRVYAFEPQPVVHRALSANILINGATQAIALNAALGDAPGALGFAEIDYGVERNFGAVSLEIVRDLAARDVAGPKASIPIMRLDDAVSVSRLKLIKSDTEGMEAALLDGASETLGRLKPYLYLECETATAAAPLFEAVERHGYDAFWHIAPLYLANNWKNDPEDVFGGVACVNLFCAPKGQGVKGLTKAEGAASHPRGA